MLPTFTKLQAQSLLRLARRAAFAKELTERVFKDASRSPESNGSTTYEARYASAVPRANVGAYKVSGYSTKPFNVYHRGEARNYPAPPSTGACCCPKPDDAPWLSCRTSRQPGPCGIHGTKTGE